MKSLLGGGEPAKDKKGKYIKKKDRVSAAENNSSWRVVSDLLVHPKKNAQRRSGVYEHIEFQQNKHDECLFQVLTCISIQNTLFQRGCYTCISSPRLATLFRQRAASAARELTSRMLSVSRSRLQHTAQRIRVADSCAIDWCVRATKRYNTKGPKSESYPQ